jgi:hypothetical protein
MRLPKNPLHSIKTVITGVEEMSLRNFIKFGVHLVAVKPVKSFYGVPKCDFAATGVSATYEADGD